MTSDNVNSLYQNSPEWKAQMDAVAKAALDKGKAEAMQDQANRSADEAKLTFKFPTGNIGSPSSSGNNIANATPIPLPAQYNKSNTAVINTPVKQTTTTTNSTAAQPTTKQDTETTAALVTKREPLISSNLNKDSYQTSEITNKDIIADAKKKGYTADEADAELKRLGAKIDYSNHMAETYGKYWNITPEQYWDPKNSPTAKQLAESGMSFEDAAKLYVGKEDKLPTLYAAYGKEMPKSDETTDNSTSTETETDDNTGDDNGKKDDTPITKPTDTPNATAQNIANGIDGAMSAASGTISPDYIDEMVKKNIANYKGNSEQWKQENIKPVKNLIQSYADGDIDGNTFVYYMSDWIGTGLRNASHFTPGAYGGNKTAETSKWDTMQQDLQNKQAQLAYDTKGADTKNMQNIANSGATATQNAANFVGAGGAEKTMAQWGKIMDPSLDVKGKMAALKAYASSVKDSKELVNGLLAYNAINGQGTGQVVSTLAMLVPEEKRSEFIDKATDALGKGADALTELLNKTLETIKSIQENGLFGTKKDDRDKEDAHIKVENGEKVSAEEEALNVEANKDFIDHNYDNYKNLAKDQKTNKNSEGQKDATYWKDAWDDLTDTPRLGLLTESELTEAANQMYEFEKELSTGYTKKGVKVKKNDTKDKINNYRANLYNYMLEKRGKKK